jgi:hypothetical protein
MLSEFVDLQPGDWVAQNGANSAVRQYITGNDRADSINTGGASCYYAGQATGIKHNKPHPEQVSFASLTLQTLSDPSSRRKDFSEVEQYLKSLGATQVMTYDDLEDKSISERVKGWTGGKVLGDNISWSHALMAL